MECRKYDEFNYIPPKKITQLLFLRSLYDWKLYKSTSKYKTVFLIRGFFHHLRQGFILYYQRLRKFMFRMNCSPSSVYKCKHSSLQEDCQSKEQIKIYNFVCKKHKNHVSGGIIAELANTFKSVLERKFTRQSSTKSQCRQHLYMQPQAS